MASILLKFISTPLKSRASSKFFKKEISVCVLTALQYYHTENHYGKHRLMILAFLWEFSNVYENRTTLNFNRNSHSLGKVLVTVLLRGGFPKNTLRISSQSVMIRELPVCQGFQAQTLLHASFHLFHPDWPHTGWQSLGPRDPGKHAPLLTYPRLSIEWRAGLQ